MSVKGIKKFAKSPLWGYAICGDLIWHLKATIYGQFLKKAEIVVLAHKILALFHWP